MVFRWPIILDIRWPPTNNPLASKPVDYHSCPCCELLSYRVQNGSKPKTGLLSVVTNVVCRWSDWCFDWLMRAAPPLWFSNIFLVESLGVLLYKGRVMLAFSACNSAWHWISL